MLSTSSVALPSLAVLLWLASPAAAHREDVSYLLAVADEGELTVAVEVSWMDLIEPGAEPPSRGEIAELGPRAHALIEPHVDLYVAGDWHPLPEPRGYAVSQRAGGSFVQVTYAMPDPPGELGLDVHLFDALGPEHKTVARVRRAERTEYAVFDAAAPRFLFAGLPGAPGLPVWPWLSLLVLPALGGAALWRPA